MANDVGVLLTNIGTPESPTPSAVKKYLKRFLSDKRVVEIHPLVWQPILRGLILPFRARQSAKLYQKIWTKEGSPLLAFSNRIVDKLKNKLNCPVALGMHYSEPSIESALEALRKENCKKIIVLPLYPQYSGPATGSSFDQVTRVLKKWRKVPEVHFINDYAEHPFYIDAICKQFSMTANAQHVLFSFHGIPQRFVDNGDPYQERCFLSAKLIADQLKLKQDEWTISFQSRLGKAKWLGPYTDVVLKKFPQQGITRLSVISPGFAVDCLETLEEIAIRGKEQFLSAGGESFSYIPALNDCDGQIILLEKLLAIL